MSRWVLEHNDEEVTNPGARAVLIPLFAGLSFLMAVFSIVAAVVGTVLGTLFHPVLRLFGRKGFIDKGPNHIYVQINRDAFRKT